MPLSEDDLKQIQSIVSAGLHNGLQELQRENTEMVSGAIKRIKAQAIDPLQQQIESLQSSVGSTVQETLNEYLEQLAAEEISELGDNTSDDESPESPLRQELLQYKKEAEVEHQKLLRRLQVAEEQQTKAQEEKARIERESRIAAMDEQVLNLLGGKVLDGKQRSLLTLLKTEGKLKEDEVDKTYKIPGKDKYGEEVLLPLNDQLLSLVQSEYSNFLPPRSGTGTGAAPVSSQSYHQGAPSGVLQEGMKASDMLGLVSDETAFKQLTADLEAQLKS